MDSFMIRRREAPVPMPLRISDTVVTMTPKPDEAELSAMALLEKLAGRLEAERTPDPDKGTPEFYRSLAGKVRAAHAEEERLARRYLAYCDDRLLNPALSDDELAEISSGIFRCQACAGREGGELLDRWQRCLAEVTVRQMGIDGKEN